MKLPKTQLSFISGIIVGGLLFGGSVAYAAGIIATPTADMDQTIILNGAEIELTGYNINGNNYFKLRDIAAAVDFGVTWSGENRAVIIDTMVGYTPEGGETVSTPTQPVKSVQSREDYSQAANSSLFDKPITRDAYNVIRQAVAGEPPISAEVTNDTFQAMHQVTAAIGVYPLYELNHYTDGYAGEICCQMRYPTAYDGAAKYTAHFIQSLDGQSDTDKVRQIDFYVCDRLTYAVAYPSPSKVLTSDDVQQGACMAYARSFQFLCQRAGIPCILLHSEDHQWNQVYVDGQWWHVDVTADDAGDDVDIRNHLTVLWEDTDMQGSSYVNAAPADTAFAKELLVPGSTK